MQKCPSCHTWNENRDYCSNCNHLLNYEIARKLEIEKKEVQEANREKDAIDNLIHRMKNSRFILVKGIFYFFYSIWFIFAAIVSFFVAIIAAGPG
jgi:Na+/melibiose symporter-like transporter